MGQYDCRKCGAKHGMIIENRLRGTFERIDYCIDCLFEQATNYICDNLPINIPMKETLINSQEYEEVDMIDQTQMNIETWLQEK